VKFFSCGLATTMYHEIYFRLTRKRLLPIAKGLYLNLLAGFRLGTFRST
jgi:hypothetical protein